MHVFKGERGHRRMGVIGVPSRKLWRALHQVANYLRGQSGADLLLQVRCAVYNGALASGFGHLFEAASTQGPQLAMAA